MIKRMILLLHSQGL